MRATFNTLIRPYLVVTIGLAMMSTIIGIPLALIWFLGVGQWWARHYYDKLECELTDKTLRFRKGIIVQIEKTIPLENIQDVTFVEGPLLRQFHLSTLKFETAGHTAGQANEMSLTGIVDAHDFRNAILAAREALKVQQRRLDSPTQPTLLPSDLSGASAQTLQNIERHLADIAALLKARS
ncbi:MAG: PH domain-containing protein [Gemmatimonadaceae bacterium]|nr:PH domain-containing protein [Gemmatimonadaceae bacterium]